MKKLDNQVDANRYLIEKETESPYIKAVFCKSCFYKVIGFSDRQ